MSDARSMRVLNEKNMSVLFPPCHKPYEIHRHVASIQHVVAIAFLLTGWPVRASEAPPIFDVHLHYTWSQAEVTSPERALGYLQEHGIDKAVVIGTPPELALELYRRAPRRIIAFFGPYRAGGEKLSWQFRDALVDEAREALSNGPYRGIGELHLIGGMATDWRRSRVFAGLLDLAREFDVPVMLHTEYNTTTPTLEICEGNPEVRLLLAHAGAVLSPEQVALVLRRCPNVWMDLAARDPWRYVRNPIADDEGRLLPGWERLIHSFPERFMIGADTVWPVDRGASWDIADSGWQELGRFIAFHRRWTGYLPAGIAEDIRWNNAENFFGLDSVVDKR